MNWTEGIAMDMHQGKAARAYSKDRYALFQRAMQVAVAEFENPTLRHNKSQPSSPKSDRRTHLSPMRSPQKRQMPTPTALSLTTNGGGPQTLTRKRAQRNVFPGMDRGKKLKGVLDAGSDRELICTIWEQSEQAEMDEGDKQIGFVILPSCILSTFADARKSISKEIDSLSDTRWKFCIPRLGPISAKQEAIFGAVGPFFLERNFDVGDGDATNPLRLFVTKTT